MQIFSIIRGWKNDYLVYNIIFFIITLIDDAKFTIEQ